MVQSNSVADALYANFGVSKNVSAIFLTLATAAVILGGIKSIARVTQVVVPFMIVFYMVGALS